MKIIQMIVIVLLSLYNDPSVARGRTDDFFKGDRKVYRSASGGQSLIIYRNKLYFGFIPKASRFNDTLSIIGNNFSEINYSYVGRGICAASSYMSFYKNGSMKPVSVVCGGRRISFLGEERASKEGILYKYMAYCNPYGERSCLTKEPLSKREAVYTYWLDKNSSLVAVSFGSSRITKNSLTEQPLGRM